MFETQFRHRPTIQLLGICLLMSSCAIQPFQSQSKPKPRVIERSPYHAVPRVVVTPLAPKPVVQDLGKMASEMGMSVKIDLKQGHRFLVKAQDRIVIMPGKSLALVNGARIPLPEAVMWHNGVLTAPDGLKGTLENALDLHPARRPKVVWKPVSMKKPVKKPTPKRWTPPPSSHKVKMPKGWDIRASRKWTHIVIHHSATRVGGAKSFHRGHKKKWKWGLGYHFVVGNGSETGVGEIEVGVRWFLQNKGVHGAHAGVNKYNQHGIGICLVGNFQNGAPSNRQLRALAGLCQKLMRKHGIPKSRVIGHKHARPRHTECPGKNFPWKRFNAML